MILFRQLNRTISARWNTVDGILEIADIPNAIEIKIDMYGQVELIKLVEEIVERDLPMGKGT